MCKRKKERKRRKREKIRKRKRERRADSLVKVGGAWHAWRRKYKAWFERVSTLSPILTHPHSLVHHDSRAAA